MGFELGMTVMTMGVHEEMERNYDFMVFVADSLERYIGCDWGEMCDEDKAENEYSLMYGGRIFASYEKEGFPKIWIITEWDRSTTTILFPSEY